MRTCHVSMDICGMLISVLRVFLCVWSSNAFPPHFCCILQISAWCIWCLSTDVWFYFLSFCIFGILMQVFCPFSVSTNPPQQSSNRILFPSVQPPWMPGHKIHPRHTPMAKSMSHVGIAFLPSTSGLLLRL